MLMTSGGVIATEIDAPKRICQICDANDQYAALIAYINEKYDFDGDTVADIIDARGYYYY